MLNTGNVASARRRVKAPGAGLSLTPEQDAVIDFAAHAWDRSKPLLITGAAGTGKSTLASQLARTLGIKPAYLAPTGKAAQVLRRKVGDDATFIGTIHSAIYAPLTKDAELYETLRAALARERNRRKIKEIRREMRALSSPSWVLQPDFVWQRQRYEGPLGINAIVVDEVSMVGEKVGDELAATAAYHGLPLIAVGDFHQLPPVAEAAYFSADNSVAAPELSEIIRQAKGSPIIDLASRIRRGERLRPERFGEELDILPRGKVNQWSYDMILVGTNRTRHRINDDFRDEQGFYDLPPQPGEPMILLRNDHERKICNGDVFEVRAIEHDDDDDEILWITGLFDDGRELLFPAKIEDAQHGADMAGEAAPVAFAYAITAHKSQGSEWRDVLVVDESKVFGLDAKRWLYTAATRAREHLTIVRRI